MSVAKRPLLTDVVRDELVRAIASGEFAPGAKLPNESLLCERYGVSRATIREAVDAHLLVVDSAGHGYTFRHALARDAVYDDLLPGERVRLHAAYAGHVGACTPSAGPGTNDEVDGAASPPALPT